MNFIKLLTVKFIIDLSIVLIEMQNYIVKHM